MAANLMRRARRRAWYIITALTAVGIMSIALHIALSKHYTVSDALFDLGFECLTAAIFFLLLDQAISGYEERQQMRLDLVNRLRGDEDSKTLMLNQLARGAVISGFNLSDSSTNLSLELEDKTMLSCQLDRCNLDSSSFNRCTFRNDSLEDSSLRLAVMETCKFESVKLDGTDLTGTLFVNCTFGAACTFTGCSLADVRFNRCSFTEETLGSMQPRGASFNSCAGINATFRALFADLGATISGVENEVRK